MSICIASEAKERKKAPVSCCTTTPSAPADKIRDLYSSVKFVELFAGAAGLTSAVDSAGLPVLPPNEVDLGGTDFRDPEQVEKLKQLMRELAEAEGTDKEKGALRKLFIHLAPPCSTFSKAKDRSWRTRVRSRAQPIGIPPRSKKVKDANKIAKECILFARWAWKELGATVVMENPDHSYIWLYGIPFFGNHRNYKDVRMSYCMYGTEYKKPTRFRVWGTTTSVVLAAGASPRTESTRAGSWYTSTLSGGHVHRGGDGVP